MAYTLANLKRDVKEQQAKLKDKLRERYQLARSVGFTSGEARILSFKAKDVFQKLIEEKNK